MVFERQRVWAKRYNLQFFNAMRFNSHEGYWIMVTKSFLRVVIPFVL